MKGGERNAQSAIAQAARAPMAQNVFTHDIEKYFVRSKCHFRLWWKRKWAELFRMEHSPGVRRCGRMPTLQKEWLPVFSILRSTTCLSAAPAMPAWKLRWRRLGLVVRRP